MHVCCYFHSSPELSTLFSTTCGKQKPRFFRKIPGYDYNNYTIQGFTEECTAENRKKYQAFLPGFPQIVENSVEKLGKYWGVILSNREKAWKIKADRIRGNVENA